MYNNYIKTIFMQIVSYNYVKYFGVFAVTDDLTAVNTVLNNRPSNDKK